MNTDIYQTGNVVDTVISGLLVYSTYKVGKQFYILTMGAGLSAFSITSTLFWSVMIAGQINYLS